MPNPSILVNTKGDYIGTDTNVFYPIRTLIFPNVPYTDTKYKPAYLTWYESKKRSSPKLIVPITNVFEHLYQIPPLDGTELPLSEVSKKDSIWDAQRHRTEQVGDIYGYEPEFERYHERMTDCSTFLAYGFNDDGLKLKNANFCRVRHCPVCQWRRSLLWKSNMYVAYEEIKDKYPKGRWLFLTLTIKNPPIGDLRETLKHMNKAWDRLVKRKAFYSVVDGWIRTTEVTRPKQKKKKKSDPDVICPIFGNTHAHPHFHVMLFVKPSYFSTGYMSQQKWSELWCDVLRVDYQPIVDIRSIRAKKGETKEDAIKNAVMETLKYSVKPDDMVGDGSKKANEWFYELTRQTFKLRFVASGGVLKNALKRDDDITNDDLVNTGKDEEESETDDRRLVFTYAKIKHRYLYNPKYNQ
ncbi:protein rep [Psychrobacter celer]|uniref:protein rep n=1 Tax=Psychrobacter celer TaxID=306572 RepID=UPI0018DF0D1C|nr:protein rep [Psychrobacter celer]